ncbi:hypothetical protein ABW20_dc0101798 [Dactylellina cionopaga]|nr:hypothetical protein ABW20_dc0101798 [Dactylellina cionopaga]
MATPSFFSSWSQASLGATTAVFKALPVNAQIGILSTVLDRNKNLDSNSEVVVTILRSLPPDVQKEVLSNITTLKDQIANCRNNNEIITSILESLPTEIQVKVLANIASVQERLAASPVPIDVQKEIITNLQIFKDKLIADPKTCSESAAFSHSILSATSPLPLPAEIQMIILGNLSTFEDQLTASQVCKYWRQLVFFCKQTRQARYIRVSNELEIHNLVAQTGSHLACRAQCGIVLRYLGANISREEKRWSDISNYAFINEPIFSPAGNAGETNNTVAG